MKLRSIVIVALVTASLLSCSDDDEASLGLTFTPSSTPQAARLVKLVQKTKSGSRVVVQAVIYGPDTSLDMYSFAFDVEIGNTDVLRFVGGSDVAGDALVPFAGQTIESVVGLGTLPGGGTDLSTVVVGVSKVGGGLGNGVSDASAVIVELTFEVRTTGTSTLTLEGSGANPPLVLDSSGSTIGTITFDSAAAGVQGISTGGGGGY